jgi:hypothetical protein
MGQPIQAMSKILINSAGSSSTLQAPGLDRFPYCRQAPSEPGIGMSDRS